MVTTPTKPSETCDQWLARLKQIECPDATYPALDPALVFDRAFGSIVICTEGKSYIDLCAGFGVLALGHNPKPVTDVLAMHGQATHNPLIFPPVMHGMGDVYPSKAKVLLLQKLREILPHHLTRGALALTGGQAIELAVKTAILSTNASGFIVFEGSYHGLDLGILSLTAQKKFRLPFIDFIPDDRVRTLPINCSQSQLQAACDDLNKCGFGIAAMVVEPIQGRAGVKPADHDWLQQLRNIANDNECLVIFDEIFCGLGRAGRMSHADLVPCDLLCLGKALGGGLPLSVCMGTEHAMTAWPESQGEALHTGTFFGHPMACETAVATLQAIVDQDLVARSYDLGQELRLRLHHALDDRPRVREIRGEGLMNALEFSDQGDGACLMDALRSQGVIALASGMNGQSISLTPALNIPEDLLWTAVERIINCVRTNFSR